MGKISHEIFWKIKKDNALLKFTLFTNKEKSALVFEAVPASAGTVKWENEIDVGLKIGELADLHKNLISDSGALKILHEFERKAPSSGKASPSEGKKSFYFEKKQNNSALLKIGVEVNNREIRNVSINLDPADLYILEVLLKKSIERIMGF